MLLYGNGDELKIHSDRPSCEISVTIQLGRSHHYAWPIFMGGQRFDLAEEDGVEKWNIACYGNMTVVDGVASIEMYK